jgi:hypothetical protein
VLSPRLTRTYAAGATYGLAAARRDAGCRFSLGWALGEHAQASIAQLPDEAWNAAYDLDGELASCEPGALRYRLLHVAARLVRTGR